MALVVPTAIPRSPHGAVTCITALELETSIICIERAARRHCPPEYCSGEKTLLHWPRCSVAPHQSIREFHLKRSGMGSRYQTVCLSSTVSRTEACRQHRSRRLRRLTEFLPGTMPPASERGCHEKCGCFNTQHVEPSGQWATPGR